MAKSELPKPAKMGTLRVLYREADQDPETKMVDVLIPAGTELNSCRKGDDLMPYWLTRNWIVKVPEELITPVIHEWEGIDDS